MKDRADSAFVNPTHTGEETPCLSLSRLVYPDLAVYSRTDRDFRARHSTLQAVCFGARICPGEDFVDHVTGFRNSAICFGQHRFSSIAPESRPSTVEEKKSRGFRT